MLILHRDRDLPAGEAASTAHEDLGLTLEQLERRHVERVLRSTGGNRTEAARLLGISRVGLYKKLQRYEEETADPRAPPPTVPRPESSASDEDPQRDERANRREPPGEAE